MQRYDYIQRAIEQLGAALARIAGLRAEGRNAEALVEVQQAYAALDLNPHLVRSLDGESLARTLHESAKVRALVRLLKEEADLSEARGELGASYVLRRRALELCKALELSEDDELAALISDLELDLRRGD